MLSVHVLLFFSFYCITVTTCLCVFMYACVCIKVLFSARIRFKGIFFNAYSVWALYVNLWITNKKHIQQKHRVLNLRWNIIEYIQTNKKTIREVERTQATREKKNTKCRKCSFYYFASVQSGVGNKAFWMQEGPKLSSPNTHTHKIQNEMHLTDEPANMQA